MSSDGARPTGLVRENTAAIDPSGVFLPALAEWAGRAKVEFAYALREHSLLIAFVALYVAYGKLLPRWFGVATAGADDLYSGFFLVLTAAAAAVFTLCYAVHLKLVVKPTKFLAALQAEIVGRFLSPRRLCMALPVLVILPFFGATFTNLKVLIPAIVPFHWDPTFAEWDRLLHGGYDPWQILQPLLGHPYVTSLINAVYHLWFFLAYGVICWQIASTERPRLRMQYILTFVLIWAVIGNIAAMLLSSAGPVYFGRVTGLPDPYAPLMSYLHQANAIAPVPALHVQDMLWRLYQSHGMAVGGGISAMPSLHVAIAVSFVLLARAIDRRLAIAFGVFALLIFLGSIHLGWHYAIDGYVAAPAAWLIWRGVGWLLERAAVARLLWGESPPPA
jgi:PAP2 superfamily protein